jgi:catechol 2,3-dioxygenase-like lactoylglutathione lyase family enzyme
MSQSLPWNGRRIPAGCDISGQSVNIIGPDSLIFGVEDLDGAKQYLTDYGLQKVDASASGATFEALDGTSAVVRRSSDPGLAPAIAPSPNLREAVYGVADQWTLERIGAELGRDRNVRQAGDGVLHSTDEDGYPIGFQIARRRQIAPPSDLINVPGMPPGRAINQVAAVDDIQCHPSTLSHFVLFSRNVKQAEKFYTERLGFRAVDYFIDAGPFMRPAGTFEHHTLFLIQSDKVGLQHFTFHLSGPNELLKAGFEFCRKGYKPFWGPGRHILGSNYFWYFNSPFGAIMEFDADMDLHDDRWVPRRMPLKADTSQTFLLQFKDKWSPSGR